MDGIDLSQIAPLTEAEADAIFDQPTAREKYIMAMNELGKTHVHYHAAIEAYVGLLRQRLADARQAQYAAESRIDGLRMSL